MTTSTPDTLGDALPREMARVRDVVLPQYLKAKEPLGSPGGDGLDFAIALMRAELNEAARALVEGDVAAMIRVYESLKGYE